MEGKLQVWITIMKSWALEEIWPAEQKRILVLIPNWKRPSLAADNKAQINGKIQSQCLYWTNSFTVFLRYGFPNVTHTISRQKLSNFHRTFAHDSNHLDDERNSTVTPPRRSVSCYTRWQCNNDAKISFFLINYQGENHFLWLLPAIWRVDEHGWRNGDSGRHPPTWLLWSSCSELGEVNDTLFPWYIHSVGSLIVSLFGRFIIRTNVR